MRKRVRPEQQGRIGSKNPPEEQAGGRVVRA